ncbi:DnaJ-domain-containing protein [Clavulina sp. PMI_390]|nr:DnaJ-domain-containing protein [Clavulina sp. PMI_390]
MSMSEATRNAFNALGLSDTATQDDAKAQYKKLALLHHPDKNPDNPHATAEFQRLSLAYEKITSHFESPIRHARSSGGGPFGFGGGPFGFGSQFYDQDGGANYDDFDDGDYIDEADMMDFFMFVLQSPINYRGCAHAVLNPLAIPIGSCSRKFFEEGMRRIRPTHHTVPRIVTPLQKRLSSTRSG